MTPPSPICRSSSPYQNHQNFGEQRTFHSVPRMPNCGPVHMGVVHDEVRQMSYVAPVRECIDTLHRSSRIFLSPVIGAAAGARAGNVAQGSSHQNAPGQCVSPPSPQNSPKPPPTNHSSNTSWLDPFVLGTLVTVQQFREFIGVGNENMTMGERMLRVGLLMSPIMPLNLLGGVYVLAARSLFGR